MDVEDLGIWFHLIKFSLIFFTFQGCLFFHAMESSKLHVSCQNLQSISILNPDIPPLRLGFGSRLYLKLVVAGRWSAVYST